jgi:hypothetical protein
VFAAARKDEGRKWTYGSVGEKGSREGAKQACCREAAAILENSSGAIVWSGSGFGRACGTTNAEQAVISSSTTCNQTGRFERRSTITPRAILLLRKPPHLDP